MMLLQLLLLLATACTSRCSWLVNTGTASKSIVIGHSGVAAGGENRPPYMAVDGKFETDWDSALDPKDQSCWIAIDFGGTVDLAAFRITGRGDGVHDTKEHVIQVGDSPSGSWKTVGTFTAQQCKPPAFPATVCAPADSAQPSTLPYTLQPLMS